MESMISVKLFMWVTGAMGTAIIGLCLFIRWLIQQLLESKNDETEAVREILPIINESNKILPRLCDQTDSLIQYIKKRNGG